MTEHASATIAGLPPFRLEAYMGQWEFAARHHLTASDAQSLTTGELLALGSEHERDERVRSLPAIAPGLAYAGTPASRQSSRKLFSSALRAGS